MQLITVRIDKPEAINFILGHTIRRRRELLRKIGYKA